MLISIIDKIKSTIESQKSNEMARLKAAEMLLERYKFSKLTITEEEKSALIIDSVAALISECKIERKYAAMILLKHFFSKEMLEKILNSENIYPFDRNDPRVRKWTKRVIKKGECEKCGSKENLEAHHIIKWADYPKGRIDINNGMCVCHKCHTEIHKTDKSYYMMKAKGADIC